MIRSPPLPCFNENTDSIDASLQCFERYAENQGWEEDNYAVFLSALLTGHVLDVYSRYPACVERLHPVEAGPVGVVQN